MNGLIGVTVLVQITSEAHGIPGTEVRLDPAQERSSGLLHVSFAFCPKLLTATLADYMQPTAREVPTIEIHHLETLTEASVTKAKGLGEGGAIGPPAAVVNAINDALTPFGVSIDMFPATPQRIRAALRPALARTQGVT